MGTSPIKHGKTPGAAGVAAEDNKALEVHNARRNMMRDEALEY